MECMDASECGKPRSVDFPPASSISARLKEDSSSIATLGDIGEWGSGDRNLFFVDPTKYSVFTYTGVAGVASAPGMRGIRANNMCSGVCNLGRFAAWTGAHTSISHNGDQGAVLAEDVCGVGLVSLIGVPCVCSGVGSISGGSGVSSSGS